MNLVNKDQVDILKSLRASVSVEKDALAKEVERLRLVVQTADDKSKMQMSQVCLFFSLDSSETRTDRSCTTD